MIPKSNGLPGLDPSVANLVLGISKKAIKFALPGDAGGYSALMAFSRSHINPSHLTILPQNLRCREDLRTHLH
jgi:hypothetical protein